jgi:hypothetical protein
MASFSFGIPPDKVSSIILKRAARRHYHRSGKHLKHVICCVETSHSFRNSRVLCDCSLQSQIAKGQPRRNVTCRARKVNRITSQTRKEQENPVINLRRDLGIMAHDTSVHDDQMLLQLPGDSSFDSSDSTVEESILSEYSNRPAGDENDDKAAKKIYTCLQGKIDHHSRGYGRFQKTPASERPILFKINGQVRDSLPCKCQADNNILHRSSAPGMHRKRRHHR